MEKQMKHLAKIQVVTRSQTVLERPIILDRLSEEQETLTVYQDHKRRRVLYTMKVVTLLTNGAVQMK